MIDVRVMSLISSFRCFRSDSVTENEDSQDSMAEDFNALPSNSTATDLSQKSIEGKSLLLLFK